MTLIILKVLLSFRIKIFPRKFILTFLHIRTLFSTQDSLLFMLNLAPDWIRKCNWLGVQIHFKPSDLNFFAGSDLLEYSLSLYSF